MKRRIYFLLSWLLLSVYAIQLNAQVDFREETIYFLLTTRFFDGDPSNNVPNEWCSYNGGQNEITDPNDVTWRGDFKGLIEKLDYIQDLGFTAIWITPIVQNWSPLDYHGYHAYDFTKVDPRLESPGATFQDLINEVHARDMKIVLDIVTNHSGRFGIKDQHEIKYNTDPTQSWGQDSDGNPLQPNPNWEYDGMTPNPDDGKIWSRANIPPLPAPYNQDLSAFNWPSTESYVDNTSVDWYHHSGNGFAQGWDDTENLYNRALAGDCPDLNTSSTLVRNYLIAAYTKFINMGVDALRWDTMKHMDKEDVLAFYDAFKAVNPDLFIFGETAQKRHELHNVEEINPHWYTWRGEVNNSEPSGIAQLDFYAEASFHGPIEDGGSFSGVKAADRYDHLYSDPSTNLLWLDNHDFGPNNDWNRRYGGTAENLAACMNFMFTWRGIPVVYYGTEMQFMKGAYADIHEASDINRSLNLTGRAYYGDVMDQAPSHKVYKHIRKLNAIRKAVPALQKGSWEWNGTNDGNGVGFIRKSGNSEVAVGLAKDGQVTFNFTGLTDGTYVDAVTGEAKVVSGGSLSAIVEPSSAAIYVLNGPGMIGANGAGFFQEGTVDPTDPVAVVNPVSEHSENPITVTMSGALGDGGPYTIYYTTDGSEPNTGSTVYSSSLTITQSTTIKAIAKDNAGKFSPVVTKNYVIGEIEGLTIHLKKPGNWNNATMYHWSAIPTGSVPDETWPGKEMVQEGASPWYAVTLEGVTGTNLIFSDNGSPQTEDLSRNGDGWYDFNTSTWYDECPGDCSGGVSVPVLTVDPTSTSFTSSIDVSLFATNSGVIYYTTDGSAPDESDTQYSGTITITGTTTLKARAFNNDGGSNTITETYTEDVIEVPVLSVNPGGGTFSSSVDVTLSASEGGEIYYTTDGSIPTESGIAYTGTITLGVGTHTIKARAFNTAGESNLIDETYTVEDNDCFTVYFRNTANWSTVNIYLWNKSTNSGLPGWGWPGVPMTPIAGTDWYSFEVCEDVEVGIIFNNGSGSQTADLSRTTDGWYEWSTQQWSNSCPGGCPVVNPVPVLSVNQESSTFTSSIDITLSATNSGTIYYTTDGSIPTEASMIYYSTITLTETTNLKAVAINDNGESNRIDETYTLTAEPEGVTVYYNNNNTNWETVSLYFWNVSPTGQSIGWPGIQMTDNDGDGWFKYTLVGATCANVIFSNNGSPQTNDLNICGTGYYDNGWVSAPAGVKTAEGITGMANVSSILQEPYPNPFSDQIRFRLSETNTEVIVKITSLQGAVVYNSGHLSENGEIHIDLDIPTGIYLMNIKTGSESKVYRIIKK